MKTLILSLALFFSLNAMGQIPTDSLKFHMTFYLDALDLINGNDGEVNGPFLAADRFGQVSSSYEYDGVDDYISCDTANFNITSEMTISVWINTMSPDTQWVVEKYSHLDDAGFIIALQDGIPAFTGRDGNNEFIRCLGDKPIDDGKWHHIVGKVENEKWQLWVDGLLENETLTGHAQVNISNSATLEFGRYLSGKSNGDHEYFNGKIDDARIYNNDLDSVAIKFLYYGDSNGGIVKMDTLLVIDTVTVVDTVTVIDTLTVTDTVNVSVSDTLRINFELTGTQPVETIQIKVFPNPTNDIVNIDIPDYVQIETYTMQILNVNSRSVYISKINQKLTQINMSEFGSTGLYFLLIYNEDMELLHNKKILLE